MHRCRPFVVVLTIALALPLAWSHAQTITDVIEEKPAPPVDASEYMSRELARQPRDRTRPRRGVSAPLPDEDTVPQHWRQSIHDGRRERELYGTGLHPIKPLRGMFNPQ